MLRFTCCSRALRPTQASLAMRRTQTNLIPIPPFLVQILKSVAINAGQQFVQAHMAESERLRKQREENSYNNGHGEQEQQQHVGSSFTGMPRPKMTGEEALRILNINPNLAVPLRGNEDKAKATENFKSLFKKAQETNSPYLQGKISLAYRMCVDDCWDKK